MAKYKTYLHSGEMAHVRKFLATLFNVQQTTVSRWVRLGNLESYDARHVLEFIEQNPRILSSDSRTRRKRDDAGVPRPHRYTAKATPRNERRRARVKRNRASEMVAALTSRVRPNPLQKLQAKHKARQAQGAAKGNTKAKAQSKTKQAPRSKAKPAARSAAKKKKR